MESVCMSMCVREGQINCEKVLMACDSGQGVGQWLNTTSFWECEGNGLTEQYC